MLHRIIQYSESNGLIKNKVVLDKSSDQPLVTNIKSVKGNKFLKSWVYSFFKEVFLPQGFPESVHKDYIQYQIWDTIQAFASTVNGTLTTHSMMQGMGVGESTATPIAAAITWILKDGTGMVGRIIFACWQGNNLDKQCKKWRFFADILNDIAIIIEVTVLYISSISSFTLCVTTGMKAIVGIAGGATRTTIMHHHAIKDNIADISAKKHSQETLVNLVGSVIGILIMLLINERFFMHICLLLVQIHIVSNYLAVTSLETNTLNEDRLSLLIEDYILYHTISSVEEINKRESVFIFRENPAKTSFGYKIEIGASFENVLKMNLIQTKDIRYLLVIFERRKYLPIIDVKEKKIYVILSKFASDENILKAYFHSCFYAIITSQMMGIYSETLAKKMLSGPSYPIMRILKFSNRFLMTLSESDFQTSVDFVSAVDQVVFEECYMFLKLLDESEWIIKSNMLPVKAWRGAWNINY